MKKINIIFSILLSLYIILIFRILSIATNEELKEKVKTQQTTKTKLIETRANFYDRNHIKLTNKEKSQKALIFKEDLNEKTIKELGININKKTFEQLKKENKPTILETTKKNNNKNIVSYEDKKRYSSLKNTPKHVIGYINKDNIGVSGLEYHLNDFLDEKKTKIELEFKVDRDKKILNQKNFNLNSVGNKNDGVVLTIDSTLQYILNTYLEKYVESGAGLILNAKTGEILAISSVPDFDPNHIEKELKNDKKPLINRAIQKSPVGSIFKIVTAACALENNLENSIYCCKGYFELNKTKFGCHKKGGHSTLDLKNAMKNSCNPYFINLGLKIGKDKMLDMATRMGFLRKIELAPGFFCEESTMPDKNMSLGELCNFSFGQGKLKASIFHIAQMLSAICNNGVGVVPQILKGYIINEKIIDTFKPTNFQCLSQKVANSLKEILFYSIKDTKADSFFIDSCGKSSTAQTGQFINKKEILNTWCCSFAPKDNPSYITVLLKEKGEFGMNDLGPLVKNLNDFLFLKNF